MASPIPRTLPWTACRVVLWSTAICVAEATLLDRWYHIGMRKLAHPAELALNYSLYALAALVLLWVSLRPLVARLSIAREATRRSLAVAEALTVGLLLAGTGMHFLVVFTLAGRSIASLGAAAALALGVGAGLLVFRSRTLGRRLVPGLLGLGLLAWLAWPSASRALTQLAGRRTVADVTRPNVVLILTDTLRADVLSCYGYIRPTTPHVDSLAAAGVRFTQLYSASSWTLPATASLLTGVFPSTHGAMTYGSTIADEPVRLASRLRAAGYESAAFTENQFVTPRYGFGDGFDSFWTYWFPWIAEDTFLFRLTSKLRLPRIEFVEKKEYPEVLSGPEDLNWDALETADRAARWIGRRG